MSDDLRSLKRSLAHSIRTVLGSGDVSAESAPAGIIARLPEYQLGGEVGNPPIYHGESRKLQDQFDTRRLADRLVDRLLRTTFNDDDRHFIESQRVFFLATTDAEGFPDCSHKGGDPGFVRVIDERTLVFPSYDGNGMFKSLGNIRANPAVGLLFLDFEKPRRLRVNGTATVSADDAAMPLFPGAQLLVRVTPHHIFPNCPRYIPRMQMVEVSPYVPRAGCSAPIPDWKKRPHFKDVLPAGDPARSDGNEPAP